MDAFWAWYASIQSLFNWANLKAFAESNFVSALFASMAGAFFGAWAVQALAERSKLKDVLSEELRSTNAAFHRCFGVLNSTMNLKRQHVQSLKVTYDANKEAVLAHHQGLANGTVPAGTAVAVEMDFRSLSPLKLDTNAIQASILDNTRVGGRPRTMGAVLASSLISLDDSIRARNEFLEMHRTSSLTDHVSVALVFGLPLPGRRIDTRYGDLISGIHSQTDDCIYFSRKLCEDLSKYGDTVRLKLLQFAKDEVANVARADFTAPELAPFLPANENYQTWEDGFSDAKPLVKEGMVRCVWLWIVVQVNRFVG